MSNSMQPHRWQPTRLCCPWDSPGKNTGVGCHFLLQCMKVKSESEVSQLCLTLSDPIEVNPPGSSIHGFSRQEYWSWVSLPSPNLNLEGLKLKALNGFAQIKQNIIFTTGMNKINHNPQETCTRCCDYASPFNILIKQIRNGIK